MARGDQLQRQWELLQALDENQPGLTVGELSSRFDCSVRTIYRDLEVLSVLFPIYTERVDGKAYWRFVDDFRVRLGPTFNFTELVSLYLSRDLFKVLEETFFHDSLSSVMQKLKRILPKESIQYLEMLEGAYSSDLKGRKDYGALREIIGRLHEAVTTRHTVEMRYYSAYQDEETTRKVDPYRLWFFNGTFYVVGYCHMREAVRIFALDRIKMLRLQARTFAEPKGFDFEAFRRSGFGVMQDGQAERVVVRFARPVARYVSERIWHPSQVIKNLKGGGLELSMEVSGLAEVKSWVLSFGSHAEVMEPESLREEVLAEHERALGRYGDMAKKAAGE